MSKFGHTAPVCHVTVPWHDKTETRNSLKSGARVVLRVSGQTWEPPSPPAKPKRWESFARGAMRGAGFKSRGDVATPPFPALWILQRDAWNAA